MLNVTCDGKFKSEGYPVHSMVGIRIRVTNGCSYGQHLECWKKMWDSFCVHSRFYGIDKRGRGRGTTPQKAEIINSIAANHSVDVVVVFFYICGSQYVRLCSTIY